MSYCYQCGSLLRESARFCVDCGTDVSLPTTATQQSELISAIQLRKQWNARNRGKGSANFAVSFLWIKLCKMDWRITSIARRIGLILLIPLSLKVVWDFYIEEHQALFKVGFWVVLAVVIIILVIIFRGLAGRSKSLKGFGLTMTIIGILLFKLYKLGGGSNPYDAAYLWSFSICGLLILSGSKSYKQASKTKLDIKAPPVIESVTINDK